MDIDSDFDDRKGPEVFQHIIDRYGKEHVANVGTFMRLQMKQVIKDVARVLDIPFEEINNFTKNMPHSDENDVPIEHVSQLKECKYARNMLEKYPKLFEFAQKLEGLPRQQGQHPAGIGVTSCEITDLIPVTNAKGVSLDEETTGYRSMFEKEQFEKSGVVKLDILKIAAARQIDDMLKLINKFYKIEAYKLVGKEIKAENIPLDDPKCWDILCDLDTSGIFQMTNPKVAHYALRKVQPRNIDELAAITSFIRPGASGLDDYVAAKKDPSARKKIDPRIDKCLERTYGAIVFQETIMDLISTVMGISFGQADIFRRALEKPKKFKEKFEEFENTFIERGVKNGFSKKVCAYIKKAILDNSGYAFNSSHRLRVAM